MTADGLTKTLDPRVTAGDLGDLTGIGTVAVGADRANDLDAGIGDTVRLRLGDGARTKLRVVALYERSLGLGEFMLTREALAGHVTAGAGAAVLIRTDHRATDSAVRDALAPYSGMRVRPAVADDVRIARPHPARTTP
ncbi:hypothetical protein NKH18_41105 [Streptomyces sp. M10(2022)]